MFKYPVNYFSHGGLDPDEANRDSKIAKYYRKMMNINTKNMRFVFRDYLEQITNIDAQEKKHIRHKSD